MSVEAPPSPEHRSCTMSRSESCFQPLALSDVLAPKAAVPLSWVKSEPVNPTQLRRRGWNLWSGKLNWQRMMGGLTVLLSVSVATPSLAADRVVVRLGPIQQTVNVTDLEAFVTTGEVPDELRLYAPFLTPEIRQALGNRLRLDPSISDKLVEDLLHSSSGERFLNTLQVAIPNANPTKLKTALLRSARQKEGISLLGFLRTFPEKTITVDAVAAMALVSQINLPHWQSQTLSSIMDRELTVKGKSPEFEFDPTQAGPYWVWKQTMTLRDYQRDRTIPVDLYWSRHQTTGPLIVLSHGFGADRRFLGYLAYHIASYGFTVAALEHPASNVAWLTGEEMDRPSRSEGKNILPPSEFIDRPKDVSFLLDRLSHLDRFSTTLKGKFNTNQVVVIGHSLGGYTALALAGAPLSLDHLKQFCSDPNPVVLSPSDLLQCNAADLATAPTDLHDPRVKQTILLNPVIGRLFNENSLAQVKIPVLMLAATNDFITPAVSQQFLPFTHLYSAKYLITAIGATHLSAGDPVNLNRALTHSIFIRERQDETESLRQLLRGVSLAFINQLTPEADRYAPFLTAAYAQSFSSPGLRLHLNSDLPPSFVNWLKMAALPMEQLISSTLYNRVAAEQSKLCNSKVHCLFNSQPLVMFILPGTIPLTGGRILLQLKRQARRQKK